MADDSFAAKLRREAKERLRHDDLLRAQRKQHDEQLSAIKAKSAREQELDGQQRSVMRTAELLRQKEQSLAGEYQAKWQALESSFGDRLNAASEQRRSELADEFSRHRKATGDVFGALWDRLKERHELQKQRREQLHAWHNELRSWQDRWNAYGGGPRDPEREDRPDEKAEHRADVESDVAAAIKEHTDESVH